MNSHGAATVCRFCGNPLVHTFVDLGVSPLCQTLIAENQLDSAEAFYPLHVRVCDQCFLVQLPEHVPPDRIFHEYPYFSSYSDTWIEHGVAFTEKILRELSPSRPIKVVEVASNDGYLLQHFKRHGAWVLGVEPAENVAKVAIDRGIPTEVAFFGRSTADELLRRHGAADLIIANNVLAHVPDINDFVAGFSVLLADRGVLTLEFPHLIELIRNNQFDTIYHEHFSYLSFATARAILQAHDLEPYSVEKLTTHGGSLRIHARHRRDATKEIQPSVTSLLQEEESAGIFSLDTYAGFDERVKATKRGILRFLVSAKDSGKTIVGYGAPGKGNTLLNYCGIRSDFLDFTVDRSPHKQGRYTPGTRIAIHAPERIRISRPDFLFILPWNLREEIVQQTSFIREWGGKWVVPIPQLQVID